MMKNITTLFIVLLISIVAKAQFLTQSADGQGSIPLPLKGVGVGIDIGKAELTVGVNNYEKVMGSNDNKFKNNYLFGLNLSVKNSEGLGNLFSSGDIVPAGNFLGFAGYSFSNTKRILKEWDKSGTVEKIKAEQTSLIQITENYRADILLAVPLVSGEITNAGLRNTVLAELTKDFTDAPDGLAINSVLSNYHLKDDTRLTVYFIKLNALIDVARVKNLSGFSRKDLTPAINAAFIGFTKTHMPVRFTPFILGGIKARNFSLFTGVNPTSLPVSFKDTLYRGGNIGIGMNLQVGDFWLGVTYSYLDGDNFLNLRSKEYTIRTVDTAGNQSLLSEKKQTAYSGRYSKVETNELNIDFVKEFRLGDTSRLITNLYYRGSLFSRDTALLKNYSNIGLGIYFTGKKSKFLGGLYVELPDINNNIEKAKPILERNTRPPLRKLTFGIVTKINLSSILNFANRPRLPDK